MSWREDVETLAKFPCEDEETAVNLDRIVASFTTHIENLERRDADWQKWQKGGSVTPTRVDTRAVRNTNAAHRPHAIVVENMLDEIEWSRAHVEQLETDLGEIRAEVERAWECWGDEDRDSFGSLAEAIQDTMNAFHSHETIEAIRDALGDDTGRIESELSGPDGLHTGDHVRDSTDDELVADVRNVKARRDELLSDERIEQLEAVVKAGDDLTICHDHAAGCCASWCGMCRAYVESMEKYQRARSALDNHTDEGLRKCEPCGGPGPCLNADDGVNAGRYCCQACHPTPSDPFFSTDGGE